MDDYDAGYTAGRKRAFHLVGDLADFYENNIVCGEDWPDDEKVDFKEKLKAQVNACRYAQHVIKTDKWSEEEEYPW